VAFAAVRLGMQGSKSTGILFYGGEPLLERQLIYDTVKYTQKLKKETGHTFYYKMTTNGLLLDEEFLKFAKKINLTIGFSHDGPAQDDCRRSPNGDGTYAMLEDKIPLLLKYQPYAIGMAVTDPSTFHRVSEIVQSHYDSGFKYIHVGVNYGMEAGWTREKLLILENEYKKLAGLYIKWTREEAKFYISPIDMKILSLIKGENYISDRRKTTINQPSIAPDGKLYPTSRHLDDPIFCFGDVFSGIDVERQDFLFSKSGPTEACAKCAIRYRCNYADDGISREGGEVVTDVLPTKCAHEQTITPIADYVAETLFKEKNALFLHKHYNELYPVMSLVEDMN
jgi:uncharacterized protein